MTTISKKTEIASKKKEIMYVADECGNIDTLETDEDFEILAFELGQTKEELMKDIEEGRAEIAAGKGIKVDVDDLEKRYGL
ncbi:MAG: hypothetical protein FWH29_00395 [Methanobrevibacter sp.]|nr:hypothetical protein [Methanobrevibacter sp.]